MKVIALFLLFKNFSNIVRVKKKYTKQNALYINPSLCVKILNTFKIRFPPYHYRVTKLVQCIILANNSILIRTFSFWLSLSVRSHFLLLYGRNYTPFRSIHYIFDADASSSCFLLNTHQLLSTNVAFSLLSRHPVDLESAPPGHAYRLLLIPSTWHRLSLP